MELEKEFQKFLGEMDDLSDLIGGVSSILKVIYDAGICGSTDQDNMACSVDAANEHLGLILDRMDSAIFAAKNLFPSGEEVPK